MAPDKGPEGQVVARAGAKYGLELSVTGDSVDGVRELVETVRRSLKDT